MVLHGIVRHRRSVELITTFAAGARIPVVPCRWNVPPLSMHKSLLRYTFLVLAGDPRCMLQALVDKMKCFSLWTSATPVNRKVKSLKFSKISLLPFKVDFILTDLAHGKQRHSLSDT